MDIAAWCAAELGSAPVSVFYERVSSSSVHGVLLADGRSVYVKVRPDDGRARSCLAAQAFLASRGFPCPRPATPVTVVDGMAVHAEEALPGGEVLPGSGADVARRYAVVFARSTSLLAEVRVPPPVPAPRWARWDHSDPGLWPAVDFLDARDQSAVPAFVVELATRLRARLLATSLPRVLGHADFEAQNLRWRDGEVWAVHDWDSLAWQPEAALAGAAAGAFANASPPSLAPIAGSSAFIEAYQQARGRSFSAEEREIAWAGSLWTAVHNARWEALHGDPPVSLEAVRAQGEERLRLANA